MKLSFWVVQTPTGDRPYVSIHKPQSYIDHLDSSSNKASVHSIEVDLPEDLEPGQCIIGCDCQFVSKVTRER